MRENRSAFDTAAEPWEHLNDVLRRKVLNGDPDRGPHTLLLQSDAREPGPAFAQYHPIDEELFALDGDFTFDGSTWFRRGSYAFYPAYFVHGASVHVRGGYSVYLRLSGPSELFTVDEPESNSPYFVGEGETDAVALQLTDAAEALDVDATSDDGAFRLLPLHRRPDGSGSSLVIAGEDAAGNSLTLESQGLLELFTVSGEFDLANGSRLATDTYHCEVAADAQLSLRCDAPGTLIISHDGALALS